MKRSIRRVEIVKKLREEGITIPSDFEEILFQNARKHYEGVLPSLKAVRAVIKICNFWKIYCADENEFSNLVCDNLYTMARIHASVIDCNNPESAGYVGKTCRLKEEVQLPIDTVTIATIEGFTLIQENYAEKFKPF